MPRSVCRSRCIWYSASCVTAAPLCAVVSVPASSGDLRPIFTASSRPQIQRWALCGRRMPRCGRGRIYRRGLRRAGVPQVGRAVSPADPLDQP
jgi:hypothetical protein